MRQRNERRFKCRLVTCRRVHVAKLCVRRHQTSARANGDERAVPAVFPWIQSVEPFPILLPPRVVPPVDVSGRERLLAGKPWAAVQRSVRSDRVCVLHVHVAGTVVHPVGRGEPVPPGFLAKERHLLVEETARVTRRSPTRSGRRHAGAVEGLPLVPTGMRGRTPFGAGASVRMIGLKFTLTSLSANSCALRNSRSAG